MRYTLDTFAILSWLNDEEGADLVEELLEKSKKGKARVFINWINIGEVYYIVQREDSKKRAIETVALIKQLPIERVGYDEKLVLLAGDYKARYPISYADSFCLATAELKKAKVTTGDPELSKIEGIEVEWVK
jgi:predicted nucleic acid-binding protein